MSGEQTALFDVRPRRYGDQVLGADVAPVEPGVAAPPAAHLARGADPTGSVLAAAAVVASGKAAREAAAVLACLRAHNGATSAELARATTRRGVQEFEQGPEAWRHTVARRLPGLEDEGLVYAVAPGPKIAKPHRKVDAHLVPCQVTRTKSIRWYIRRPAPEVP